MPVKRNKSNELTTHKAVRTSKQANKYITFTPSMIRSDAIKYTVHTEKVTLRSNSNIQIITCH